MIGGIVNRVLFDRDRALVFLVDKVYGDRMWRSIPLNERTRCVGIGDTIWWHNPKTLWTPKESERKHPGRDFDIDLGKCWAIADPEQTATPPGREGG